LFPIISPAQVVGYWLSVWHLSFEHNWSRQIENDRVIGDVPAASVVFIRLLYNFRSGPLIARLLSYITVFLVDACMMHIHQDPRSSAVYSHEVFSQVSSQ